MPANEVQARRNAWKNLSLEDLDVLPFRPQPYRISLDPPYQGPEANSISSFNGPSEGRQSAYERGGVPAMIDEFGNHFNDWKRDNNDYNRGLMNWGRDAATDVGVGLKRAWYGPSYSRAGELHDQFVKEEQVRNSRIRAAQNPVMAIQGQPQNSSPVSIVEDTPVQFHYNTDSSQFLADDGPMPHYTPAPDERALLGARGLEGPIADLDAIKRYRTDATHTQMHGASIVDMSDLDPNDVLDLNHEMWANDQDRGYADRKAEANLADQERRLKWLASNADPSNPIHARQLDAEVMSMNNAIKQRELVNAHYGEREKVLAALNADRYGAEQRANAEIAAAQMKGGKSGPSPEDITDALIKSGVPPQVAASNATVMAGLESAAVAKMFEDLVSRHNKEMDPGDIASLANAFVAAHAPGYGMGNSDDPDVMQYKRMRNGIGNYLSQQMTGDAGMKELLQLLQEEANSN